MRAGLAGIGLIFGIAALSFARADDPPLWSTLAEKCSADGAHDYVPDLHGGWVCALQRDDPPPVGPERCQWAMAHGYIFDGKAAGCLPDQPLR